MLLEKRADGWWIMDPRTLTPDCGPYATKAEAESDMRGMVRTVKHADEPGYVTSEVRHADH